MLIPFIIKLSSLLYPMSKEEEEAHYDC